MLAATKHFPEIECGSAPLLISEEIHTPSLPEVDLFSFLQDPTSPAAQAACKQVAEAFRIYGALLVKDPRVTEKENEEFLDLMEAYFGQEVDILLQDARPAYAFQVGVTPSFQEVPRCSFDESCLTKIAALSPENKPQIPTGPDPKWRFFWRIGERPPTTKFPELNAQPVIPKAFPKWSQTMDQWGTGLYRAVEAVTEMLSVGLGMDPHTLTNLTRFGPHLLAPTGSDLSQFGKLSTIFAGFHYDLNFLTIHGKSRFPGLMIWTREGRRIQVRVPSGYLLVQAGKQLEHLTAGYIEAGYHEVIVLEDTLNAIAKAKEAGRSLWRISSTLFYHVASDQILQPLPSFQHQNVDKYPPIFCGEHVQKELLNIDLTQKTS